MRLLLAAPVSLFVFVVAPATAHAQSAAGCDTPRPVAIGAAVGRSDPYFEPSGGIATGSRGSLHLAARADLPVAGAWRSRVEGASTDWRLERQIYSADLREVVATDVIGRVDVRHLVWLLGRLAGRPPACAYVLAGGGFYALGHGGRTTYEPGVVLVAGIEFPGGRRGAVQVDVQLHLVNTGAGGRPPIGSSTVVDTRLTAAWVFHLRR